MADIVINAADVICTASTGKTYVAGEAVAAGNWVYKKAADGKAWKADCTSAATKAVIGMALNSAAAGQPVNVLSSGPVTVGNVLTGASRFFVLSKTAGLMGPEADLSGYGGTDYGVIVGYSTSATVLFVNIIDTDTQYS